MTSIYEQMDQFLVYAAPGRSAFDLPDNDYEHYPIWQKWLRDHQPLMLVIWGRYDPSFIVAGAEAYRKDVPTAEVHILDAGHFALDEQAPEVIRLTEAFMQKLMAH